jgi:hypothetical protein
MNETQSRRRRTWIISLVIWGLALVGAAAFSYFTKLNFWLCLGVVAAAWMINSVVAEIEDRIPGGFLNPRKDKKD